MKVADKYQVCVPFFELLKSATSRVLMLDYDGTLAPFTPDRTRAFPYREIPNLVAGIMRRGTRVILVSGRAAVELVRLSGINPHPEIWGSHGSERLHPDGSYKVDEISEENKKGLQQAHQALRAAGLSDQVETKPAGIAVHWRGQSPPESAVTERKVHELCDPVVNDYGLLIQPFDGGLEIRVPGRNKGDAVNTILTEAGSGVAAAYLGDDQTDENAFCAIKGRGLAVLVRPEPRPSIADVWLQPPEELGRFLRDWLVACGAER
jgi:trehalose 6-phosphate phosphatase